MHLICCRALEAVLVSANCRRLKTSRVTITQYFLYFSSLLVLITGLCLLHIERHLVYLAFLCSSVLSFCSMTVYSRSVLPSHVQHAMLSLLDLFFRSSRIVASSIYWKYPSRTHASDSSLKRLGQVRIAALRATFGMPSGPGTLLSYPSRATWV